MKKKVLFTSISLMLLSTSFAQKLNFSKSIIYFGKNNPVAKVENQNDGSFIYTEVDGTKVFQVIRKTETAKNSVKYDFVEVKDLESNKTNEIPFETIGFVFSKDAEIFNSISRGNTKLVGDNGIDKPALKALMESPKVDYTAKIKHINDSIDAVFVNGKALMQKNQITIDSKGNLLQKDIVIGGVKKVSGKDGSKGYDIVSKKENLLIAKWRNKGAIDMGGYFVRNTSVPKMLTFNLNEYVVIDEKNELDSSQSIESSALVNNLIAVLYANGIDISLVTLDDIEESKKIAKDNGNIRRAKGYVVTADGQKIEGLISIDFLEESTGNIMSVGGGYGKRVTLFVADGKKEKKETYKSTDNVSFFAEDSKGVLQEYRSFKIDLSSKTLGFLNNLSEGMLFHQKIYQKGDLALYRNITGKQFVLKKDGDANGYFISGGSKDVVIQNVKQYLGCETINLDGIDFYKGKSLVEMVDRYSKECK